MKGGNSGFNDSQSTNTHTQGGGATLGNTSPYKGLYTILGVGPKVPMGQENIHINPPKLDECQSDEDEEEEDEPRPLTRDELKMKTLSRLQRRGGQNVGNKVKGSAGKGNKQKLVSTR
jgi:hypothetical protein